MSMNLIMSLNKHKQISTCVLMNFVPAYCDAVASAFRYSGVHLSPFEIAKRELMRAYATQEIAVLHKATILDCIRDGATEEDLHNYTQLWLCQGRYEFP